MINPFAEFNWKPNLSELRKFGRSLLLGGLVMSSVFLGLDYAFPSVPFPFGKLGKIFLVILALGLFSFSLPKLAKPIYWVWFFLAACIGGLISNFFLLLFYFAFFTPIACGLRLTGRDPLWLRAKERSSTWIDHQTPKSLARYYRQY